MRPGRLRTDSFRSLADGRFPGTHHGGRCSYCRCNTHGGISEGRDRACRDRCRNSNAKRCAIREPANQALLAICLSTASHPADEATRPNPVHLLVVLFLSRPKVGKGPE